MFLEILRHGIAEDSRPGGADAARRLTPAGIRKLRLVLQCARGAKVAPSLILSSPYVRARQTAELAAEILRYEGKIVETSALAPNGRPPAIWEEVRSRREEEDILLASHEPLCSQLVSFLLGAPSLQVNMKKGAMVRLTIENLGASPRGVLEWMLTAKLAGGGE